MSDLVEATKLIAKVVDGIDLSAEESEKVFHDVFLLDKDGYHAIALIAALHAKGETSDELLGFINVHKKLGVKIDTEISPDQITDLSGTGAGTFKTINISTTASFIVAAAGYTVLKAAYFGITSPTGSADIFNELGVDIFDLTTDQIKNNIENAGICPFYLPAISPQLSNRAAIVKKVFVEKGVRIKSILHLVSNTLSPVPMNARIYGCYDAKYLETIARMFAKLEYKHTLTFTARDGFPEISNVGITDVVEQKGDEIKKYELTPEDFGVKKAILADIAAGDKEQNMIDFLKILHGLEKGPKLDIVCMNAAASLYVLGKVASFKDGQTLAKELITSGKTKNTIELFINKAGDVEQYNQWIKKIKTTQ